MSYEISKQFMFEAAHRLVNGYTGKCANVHGHSWAVEVFVRGDHLDEYDFLIDFGNLKPIREWVDENLDHACILSKKDVFLISTLQSLDNKLYVTDANPTSETLCKLIFDKAKILGLNPVRVEIKETCTSRCSYGER